MASTDRPNTLSGTAIPQSMTVLPLEGRPRESSRTKVISNVPGGAGRYTVGGHPPGEDKMVSHSKAAPPCGRVVEPNEDQRDFDETQNIDSDW